MINYETFSSHYELVDFCNKNQLSKDKIIQIIVKIGILPYPYELFYEQDN